MKIERVEEKFSGVENFLRRHPFIIIGAIVVIVFLVFLLIRPERRQEVDAPAQPHGVGAGALGIMHMLEDVMVRQEELALQKQKMFAAHMGAQQEMLAEKIARQEELAAHKQEMFAAQMGAMQEMIATQAARQEELTAHKHTMLAAQQERHAAQIQEMFAAQQEIVAAQQERLAAQLAAQQERFIGQKQAFFDALRDVVAVPPQPQVVVIEPQHDEQIYENIAARQEELAAQIEAIQDALRDDRVEPIIEPDAPVTEPRIDPRVLDYYVLDYYADPERYRREIMREDIIRPARPRKNGLILTAAGEWEPVESVIARQKERYKRALAEGRIEDAKLVQRETEIALGRPVDW